MFQYDEAIAIFNLNPFTLLLETQDHWLSILQCRRRRRLTDITCTKREPDDFEAMHLKNWTLRQQSFMHVLRSPKEDVVHFGSFENFPELFSIVKPKHLAALAEALRSHESLHLRMLVTTLEK